MNSDFELGVKLHELQVGNPALDFSQCLVALVNDDINLKNAFDHLSIDHTFSKYFDGTCDFDSGQKTEVNAFVDSKLAAPIVSRVREIFNGYISSSVTAYQKSLVEKSIRSGEYDSSTISNPSCVENATLFAAAASTSQNQPSISSVETGAAIASKPKFPVFPLLAALLALALVGGLAFALFNVEALCEPLGLCDDDLDKGSNNRGDSEKSGRIDDPVSGKSQSESTHQTQPEQNRQAAPQVIPPPRSTQPQPVLLPDREEALW